MAAEIGLVVSRVYSYLLDGLIEGPSTQCSMAKDCLLLAGAGAGVTANFDTPLTGAIYAHEVIHSFRISRNR